MTLRFTLHFFLLFLFTSMANSSLTAQMSKNLAKAEATTPKENTEGEPEMRSFKDQLIMLIEKDPIFLNPNISNDEVARLLRTSTSVVDMILETDFGQDYNDFINTRRVKAAIELLHHTDFEDIDFKDKAIAEEVLIDIARQCGFKGKSELAKMFKKYNNLPLQDYIEKEILVD